MGGIRETKTCNAEYGAVLIKRGERGLGQSVKEMVGLGVEVLTFLSRGGVWILVVKREMEIKKEEQGRKRRNRVNEYE